MDQETYGADPGTEFLTVSKAQLINSSTSTQPFSSHFSLATANEVAVPTDAAGGTQSHLEENKSPQSTPANDVIEGADTDTGRAWARQRKARGERVPATTEKRGPGKALFAESRNLRFTRLQL